MTRPESEATKRLRMRRTAKRLLRALNRRELWVCAAIEALGWSLESLVWRGQGLYSKPKAPARRHMSNEDKLRERWNLRHSDVERRD